MANDKPIYQAPVDYWSEQQFVVEARTFSKVMARRVNTLEKLKWKYPELREVYNYEQEYLKESIKNLDSARRLMEEVKTPI